LFFFVNDFLNQFEDGSVDLLITDPPYSTDVDDIKQFAQSWLNNALKKVKDSGYAFVFIGAYPEEINAYLNISMPTQILVWEYKNTLGQNPKDKYKQNYQAILFYRMAQAGSLNIEITNEQWAVQSINAPDGRLGDRYHSWQKPIELADRLIRHTTNTGEQVIDPFCCTGTFLLAASKLNRIATGCDISDKNLKIAIQRGCQYA
jgi:DNA modification methylase